MIKNKAKVNKELSIQEAMALLDKEKAISASKTRRIRVLERFIIEHGWELPKDSEVSAPAKPKQGPDAPVAESHIVDEQNLPEGNIVSGDVPSSPEEKEKRNVLAAQISDGLMDRLENTV